MQQPVARRVEAFAETRVFDDKLHVGVVEQQIVIGKRRRISMVERGVARLLEIVEGEFMQLARQVARGKERPDEILRPIGRARIADDPAIDVVGNRAQATLQVRHLVLDDHVEAEALAVCHMTVDPPDDSRLGRLCCDPIRNGDSFARGFIRCLCLRTRAVRATSADLHKRLRLMHVSQDFRGGKRLPHPGWATGTTGRANLADQTLVTFHRRMVPAPKP
ncbi:hypothetical protein EN806_43550 [bacterium M00.F.Ca.ET.163.01.1.1]|nr:hypothetical protein EN806_43550 [bacterium M00.F.Ca.ET.163.01.1.1]